MTTSPAGPIAPLPRRAIACVIDNVIMAVIVLVGYGATTVLTLSGLTPENAASRAGGLVIGIGATLVVALVWFVVFCMLQGSGGSVGMRIMKLRLVRDGSETPLGFGRALLRNIVFSLSTAIIVGYFTPLFDGSGRFQGWHDRAAGALMRDVRGGAVAPADTVHPATAGTPAAAVVPPVPAPGGAFASPQHASRESAPEMPSSAPSFAPPQAPQAAAPAVALAEAAVEVDPHDATVLAPAVRAASASPAAPAPAPVVTTSSPAAPVTPAADDGGMITTVPGVSPSVPAPAPVALSGPETVAPARPPVPAAPPASVEAAIALTPIAQAAEDEDLEETRISIPGHRLQFVWDDGVRVAVSGRTLFGRNPAPEAGATAVVVRDETLSLSKTHFEAAAEAAGGWVLDRHSTNGMTIVRDGVRIACPPGERVRIRLGDAIEIGDRIVTVGGYA